MLGIELNENYPNRLIDRVWNFVNESETIERNPVNNQISNANQFTSTGSYPISCICILKFKPQVLLLRVIFF